MPGMAFLFVPEAIIAFYAVTTPSHTTCIEFSAFLPVISPIMFFRIAMDRSGSANSCWMVSGPGSLAARWFQIRDDC
jgi:hypothetical protein